MSTQNDPQQLGDETTDEVVDCLRDMLPEVRFAYVFGSAVRGDQRPDSDLDLAVEAGRRLEATERFRLAGELERIVGRPVDVLDLTEANAVIRMQVLQHGSVLLNDDRTALAEFEMYTPAIYEDWKHLSRPFEEALTRQFEA